MKASKKKLKLNVAIDKLNAMKDSGVSSLETDWIIVIFTGVMSDMFNKQLITMYIHSL